MNDNWDDEFMPDDGDFGITIGEAMYDVLVFLAKVVGLLLFIAIVIGSFAYSIWREFAIFQFLTGQ